MKKRVISLFVLASMSYVHPVAFNLPFKRIRPTKRSVKPVNQTTITPQKKPLMQQTRSFVRKPFGEYLERRRLKKRIKAKTQLATFKDDFARKQKGLQNEQKYFDETIQRAASKVIPAGTPDRETKIKKVAQTYKSQVAERITQGGPQTLEQEQIKYIKYGAKVQAGTYPFKHTSQLQKLKPLPPTPGQAPQIQQQPPLTPKKPALEVFDPKFNPFGTPAQQPTGDTIDSFFSDVD